MQRLTLGWLSVDTLVNADSEEMRDGGHGYVHVLRWRT